MIKIIDLLKHIIDEAETYRRNMLSSQYKGRGQHDKKISKQQVANFIDKILLKDVPYEQ